MLIRILSSLRPSNVKVTFKYATVERSGFIDTKINIALVEKDAVGKDCTAAWDEAINKLNMSFVEVEKALRESNEHIRDKKKLAREAIFKSRHKRDIDALYEAVHKIKEIRSAVKNELRRAQRKRDKAVKQDAQDAQRLEAGGTYCVYSIDHGNAVYIGISKSFKRRLREHLNFSHNQGVRGLITQGARPTVVASNLSKQEAFKVESDVIASMKATSKVVHNIKS